MQKLHHLCKNLFHIGCEVSVRANYFVRRSSTLPQLRTMKFNSASFESLFTQELKDLASLFRRHGYEIRIAGGAVRDLLTDKTPSDLDFATTATPDEMKKMFEEEGIRMINKRGEQHGTVTCRINDKENFEVTTLRIDVVTDGRHAEVEFTTDWQRDAERRDLTINAMFLGLDGTLFDYYGGQDDLDSKTVQFVGNAAARIQEDYLRILRYFRFYGRISDLPNAHDETTLKAIRDNAHGLAGISGERIWVEVKKIVTGRHVPSLMRVMFELGVARHVGFPADSNLDNFEQVWMKSVDLEPQCMTLISALLETEQQVYHLHDRVKMSNEEKELGLFIVNHRGDDFGSDRFSHCQDLVCDTPGGPVKPKQRVCELMKYMNDRTCLARVDEWIPPRFPVKGEQLLEAGVPKGRAVGQVMTYLQQKWKESRYTSGSKELLEFVDEAMKTVL